MTRIRRWIPLALVLLATVAAKPVPPLPSPPIPLPGPAGWAKAVDHPYFPLRPGTVRVYSTRLDDHEGADTITVLRRTKVILGITATVVRDRTYESGALVEDSYNWYAQDASGNVWYLGEATKELHAGRVVSTAGSWEAGLDGAQPGIVMWASPKPGTAYRMEHRSGVAEDAARVLKVSVGVDAGSTSFPDCVQIENASPLEPGVREHRFYARGFGLVLMQTVAGAKEDMELEKVIGP